MPAPDENESRVPERTPETPRRPSGGEEAARGELVQWDGAPPRARFALPGEPRALGAFTAPGRPGILIRHDDGSFALHEP